MDEYLLMLKDNQYSANATSRFPSLKDVLKKRVQFNQQKSTKKENIYNKYSKDKEDKKCQEQLA